MPIETARDQAIVVWMTAGSCEGCTMSMLGATAPSLEEFLSGALTHIPSVRMIHPMLSLDAGEAYIAQLESVLDQPDVPYLLVVEGALTDPARAGAGVFSRIGPATPERWVERLAPTAAAVVAIGTCATAGGIPAAAGSPTGAHSLSELLGDGFRSAADLPIINVPGCAPQGDAFIEVLSFVLLHLGGRVPLDLDAVGRPRWLYDEVVKVGNGSLVAECGVPGRGWINHLGGCESVGGMCIGCTRSDFPDGTAGAVYVELRVGNG